MHIPPILPVVPGYFEPPESQWPWGQDAISSIIKQSGSYLRITLGAVSHPSHREYPSLYEKNPSSETTGKVPPGHPL